MGSNLTQNYIEVAAVIIFCIGFTNLFLQGNLLKKIIGLNIMDTATYLFLAVKGYVDGGLAPVLQGEGGQYINPVPGGLVLTGIVVSVSVSALMLALTVCLYMRFHTLELDEISRQLRSREKHHA